MIESARCTFQFELWVRCFDMVNGSLMLGWGNTTRKTEDGQAQKRVGEIEDEVCNARRTELRWIDTACSSRYMQAHRDLFWTFLPSCRTHDKSGRGSDELISLACGLVKDIRSCFNHNNNR